MLLLAACCLLGGEIDINGKFENGLDGWFTGATECVSEVKIEESSFAPVKVDTSVNKKHALVASRMYYPGQSGDKVTLDAVVSGRGTAYVGVVCFEAGGSQTGIHYSYIYLGKGLPEKKYSFNVTLPKSNLKDSKGVIRETAKFRIIFGALPDTVATFKEINAVVQPDATADAVK